MNLEEMTGVSNNVDNRTETFYGLTEEQMRKLSINENLLEAIQDVFKDMDEDGNGTLSIAELGDAMSALGVAYNDKDLENIMKEIDTNGDGQIDFFEFSQMISSKLKRDPATDLRQDFAQFDLDGDGSITTQELRTELESLGEHLSEAEIKQMMEEADENHDGTVDFAEFCKIWTGQDGNGIRGETNESAESNQSSKDINNKYQDSETNIIKLDKTDKETLKKADETLPSPQIKFS